MQFVSRFTVVVPLYGLGMRGNTMCGSWTWFCWYGSLFISTITTKAWLQLYHNRSNSTHKKCLLFHPTTKCTTPCLMTCSLFKIDVFTFRIISLNVFMRRRPNSQWSNPNCCLFYIDNAMPADVLATLGARASAGMVMIPEPEYSSPASEEISLRGRSQIIVIRIQCASDISRFIVSQ